MKYKNTKEDQLITLPKLKKTTTTEKQTPIA
jgi:hypothetical protein